MPQQKTYWLQETWSARKREDGSLEPDVRISGVGIAPHKEDDALLHAVVRDTLTLFNKLPATEPFFIIQAEFTLVEPSVSSRAIKETP